MTFHDMNYSKYRHLYVNTLTNNIDDRERCQKMSVERADKIVAVSQQTKDDLVNYWQVDSDKVVVIHHGVDKTRKKDLDPARFMANPFLLFVGERYGFKNFERFLKAFMLVSNKYPDLRLVCTGRKFTETDLALIQLENATDKVIQQSADEDTLARLYRDAEMFVFPSFSEGFGMPIREAMVYGCR